MYVTNERKTNVMCLNKMLGHHMPPSQLPCTLALILQSLNSIGGGECCKHVSLKSPIVF